MRRKLMTHQAEALNFILEHKGCAGLFMAPGTGKTLVAIRYAQGSVIPSCLPKLIICRRDDFLTWKQELQLEGVSLRQILFVESGTPLKSLPSYVDWAIITYDLVKEHKRFIHNINFGMVIADESHMIKRWKAQRTKKVIRATCHIPRRLAMTGTPITNDPGDVFTQCLFIDNGKLFGNNNWNFRNAYYIQSGPGWYLKHNAKKRIIEKLTQIAYCVHEDDVLKLPPVRRITKAAIMGGMQRRYYKKVLNEWEIQLGDGQTIEINQVIVQLAKLRQITSGFVYDQNHKAVWLKSYKLKLLIELLKDPDYLANKSKIVIWCSHTAEICMLVTVMAHLKLGTVAFFGGNRKQKERARIKFRDDPSVRVFIGQVDSGMGMNELVVSDTAIYFSNSLKVVSRQQSERRIRRYGSEIHSAITYWDLVVENSIDEHILKSLRQGISVADYILKKIREGQQVSRIL